MQRVATWMWAGIAALALAVAFDGSVHAQESAAAAQASALIDEGVELRRRGDDEAALPRFRAAFELTRSARARAQIALVEQALARWVDAEAHLLEALGSHEPWIEERRATLEQQLTVIRSHLSQVRLDGGVPGAEVRLNNRPVGALPMTLALWIEPGPVEVVVRADGYRTYRRTLDALTGQLVTLTIELEREGAAAPQAVTTPPASTAVPTTPIRSDGSRDDGLLLGALGWSAIGVGGASLILSAVALAVRNGEAGTFNSEMCLAGGLTRGENCRTHYDAAQMWESVSVATLVIAGVLAAGGVALVVIEDTSGSSEAGSSTSIACSATLGPTWGAVCGGQF